MGKSMTSPNFDSSPEMLGNYAGVSSILCEKLLEKLLLVSELGLWSVSREQFFPDTYAWHHIVFGLGVDSLSINKTVKL